MPCTHQACFLLVSCRPLATHRRRWYREHSRAVVLVGDAVPLASNTTPPLCSALQSTERLPGLRTPTRAEERHAADARHQSRSEAAPNAYGSQ